MISSTELILDVLNEHVNASKYRSMLETMHLFGKGNMQLVKVAIPERSPVDGKRLAEIDFPHNSVVVAVDRPDSDLEIPTGETTLRAGDSMIVIVKNGAGERIRAHLGSNTSLLNIALAQGDDGRLRAIRTPKASQEYRECVLSRSQADVQVLGDFGIRRPSEIRRRISVSRGVSGDERTSFGRVLENCASTTCAICGSKNAPPSAAMRTASTMRSGSEFFRQ